MADGNATVGCDTAVEVNGFRMFIDKHDVSHKGTDIGTKNVNSNLYDEGKVGFRGADIRVSGYFDIANMPLDDPLNLTPGIRGPVKIYESVAEDFFYNFPLIRVLDSHVSLPDADGRVEFEFTAKSHGAFTVPGGIPGNGEE